MMLHVPTSRPVRRSAIVATGLLLLLPSFAWAQVTLRYRWTQGQSVTYKTTLKTDSTVSGMPGTPEVALSQTMTQRITLLAAAVAPDGSATLRQTIEAISVQMDTPMGTVAYDSADAKGAGRDPSSAGLAKVFGAMVGATLSVSVSSDGAIQHIDGVQKVVERITRDLPQDRAAPQMTQILKSVLSEDAVRASLEQSFPRLPSQPIAPGGTWTTEIGVGTTAAGKITGTQTLTLKSVDGGVATIAVALALKQESAPALGPSGMVVTLGESRGEGTLAFDVAAGRIRSAAMKTDMPSTMTAAGPDGRPAMMKNATRTSMTMEEMR